MSKFAYRIKNLRGNKTMAEFGKIIDTKVATISSWENGGIIPKPEKLKDIADKLDVTLDYLLGYTNYNGNQPIETLTHIGPEQSNTILQTSPTAIIQTDETGLSVTTSPTNVLVATDPRGSIETEYINPLIQLILNSKQQSNIVLDDVNSSILSNIEDTIDASDYTLKIFDEHKPTFKINLLEYIKHKSEDELFEIFRAYFKLNGDGDTFYWNHYFAMFLTFKYQLYRDHSDTRLSHAGFYEFLMSNDTNVLVNPLLDALYKTEDRYEDLNELSIDTIKLFANDPFVQMMDAADEHVLDYPNDLQNTITIFNYGVKPSKTFNTYSAIIKNDIIVNNLHQDNQVPTHWLLNASHPFHLSEVYFSFGLGQKQYITLISDAELLIEKLSNAASIFHNSSIIINFSRNIDMNELCEKRIRNRHYIRYDKKPALPDVPYVVTSNDIYPYHLSSYDNDNTSKIDRAMALLSEAMKIIEDIKKD